MKRHIALLAIGLAVAIAPPGVAQKTPKSQSTTVDTDVYSDPALQDFSADLEATLLGLCMPVVAPTPDDLFKCQCASAEVYDMFLTSTEIELALGLKKGTRTAVQKAKELLQQAQIFAGAACF